MKRFAFVMLFAIASTAACRATTRHYYIAAEDVPWDYAPSGMDLLHGRAIPLPWAKQTRWEKTRFIEYSDASFAVRKPQPEWLGILGPVIRAEVGNEVIVDFLNRSRLPHSIHPHGLRYEEASEGALYEPAGAGSRVYPGTQMTDQIGLKLLGAEIMMGLHKLQVPDLDLGAAKRMANSAVAAVKQGQLGYALICAKKPD